MPLDREQAAPESASAFAPRASRSIGIMVAASLLTAFCGVVQTFWIPRALSVESFGYWRTFLLYVGYAGMLHFGLVDGALLLWSRPAASTGPRTLAPALRFLAVEHLLLLALACGLRLVPLPSSAIFVPILAAVVGYAMVFNLTGLLQVYLQSHLRFTAVAFAASAPGVLFVASLGILAVTHTSISRLITAYLVCWTLTFVLLLSWLWRDGPATADAAQPPGTWKAGWSYIAIGWPIMLANAGFGLMQSADRVTVNLTRPIHDFAIYSLSQSTIYVPIALLAAISRVAFSYFARISEEGRAAGYRLSTRILTAVWMLLLPYFFGVAWVVRHFLPKYTAGLPAGRVLLLSVLFLSLIQIVQLNTFSLQGRQRQFFAGSIVAVAVAFATAWIGARMIGSLTAVAWSQVITAMLWWVGNELYLRRRTGVRPSDILRVLAGFGVASIALAEPVFASRSARTAAPIYLLIVVPACLLLFRDDIGLLPRGRASA